MLWNGSALRMVPNTSASFLANSNTGRLPGLLPALPWTSETRRKSCATASWLLPVIALVFVFSSFHGFVLRRFSRFVFSCSRVFENTKTRNAKSTSTRKHEHVNTRKHTNTNTRTHETRKHETVQLLCKEYNERWKGTLIRQYPWCHFT